MLRVWRNRSLGEIDVESQSCKANLDRVVICIAEGLCIFLIAMIWRIISFKYTHLVERLQLLTLIIIGEGIIGMVKSVSCITKGQYSNNMSEIGTVIAAVLLLVRINYTAKSGPKLTLCSTSCGCCTLINSPMIASALYASRSGAFFTTLCIRQLSFASKATHR